MNSAYPAISCVVIGLNCEKSVRACLESIKKSAYQNMLEIIYVDGGSKDKSIPTAKATGGIKVIELNPGKPTPGKGRNAGWHVAAGEWIHFFDSDTIVDKNWISEAVKHIDEKTGAVFGWRKEIHPRKNWFHFIANLEWTNPVSNAKFFGGDVLIKRSILEETAGYDEVLIAGEEPELSARIRQKGWKIRGIDALMCYHDININSMKQYFKRAYRSGYGYAEAGIKMLKSGEYTWFLKMIKISAKWILVLFLVIYSLFFKSWISGLLALVVIFLPLRKALCFKKSFNIIFKEALIYALHCSIVIWPQFLGISDYFFKQAIIKSNIFARQRV